MARYIGNFVTAHQRVALAEETRVNRLNVTSHWRRLAYAHLSLLNDNPVHVQVTHTHRYVDLVDHFGVRVDLRTGEIRTYDLKRTATGRLRRRFDSEHARDILHWADGAWWSLWVIVANAAQWETTSGERQVHRHPPGQKYRALVSCVAAWLKANGSDTHLSQIVSDALALEAPVLDLAAQSMRRVSNDARPGVADYNRVLRNRAAYVDVAASLPHLLPLFAHLFPEGCGELDPKQALKQHVLAGGTPPRVWRWLCQLQPDVIELTYRWVDAARGEALLGLATLLTKLQVQTMPPVRWLAMVRGICGTTPFYTAIQTDLQRVVFQAHLRAWLRTAPSDHLQLARELSLVDHYIDKYPQTRAETAVPWSEWRRRALQWATQQRMAASAWDDAQCRHNPREPRPAWIDRQLMAVPLVASVDLFDEGVAMGTCVYTWHGRVARKAAVVFSIRDALTQERVATAGRKLDQSPAQWEIKGVINSRLDDWLIRSISALLAREEAPQEAASDTVADVSKSQTPTLADDEESARPQGPSRSRWIRDAPDRWFFSEEERASAAGWTGREPQQHELEEARAMGFL